MTPAYILTGPQGIGKTTRARELAELLHAIAYQDDDNGVTCATPRAGMLTITTTDPDLPHGAVQFTVADAAGLEALFRLLRRAHGVDLVDIPAFLIRHAPEHHEEVAR